MRDRLTRGSSVIVFPEGTRSPDGSVAPFREGAFRLAIELGVDVVPLAVAGTENTLPKHSLVFQPDDGDRHGPPARFGRGPDRGRRSAARRARSRRDRDGDRRSRRPDVRPAAVLDLALVAEARRAIAGRVRRTPVEESPGLSEIAGVPVVAEARVPPADRLLQDPRSRSSRWRASTPGERAPRRRDLLGRKPRQGRRLGRARARDPGRDPRSAKRRRVEVPRHGRARRARPALGLRRLRRDRAAREGRGGAVRPAVPDRLRRRRHPRRQRRHARGRGPRGRARRRARSSCPVGGAGLAGGFAFYAKSRSAGRAHRRLPARRSRPRSRSRSSGARRS